MKTIRWLKTRQDVGAKEGHTVEMADETQAAAFCRQPADPEQRPMAEYVKGKEISRPTVDKMERGRRSKNR